MGGCFFLIINFQLASLAAAGTLREQQRAEVKVSEGFIMQQQGYSGLQMQVTYFCFLLAHL